MQFWRLFKWLKLCYILFHSFIILLFATKKYYFYSTFCVHCTATISDQCTNGNDAVLWAPQILLFTAQFISGIGQPLYSTLGISYMDDNIQKSKTPAFVSK